MNKLYVTQPLDTHVESPPFSFEKRCRGFFSKYAVIAILGIAISLPIYSAPMVISANADPVTTGSGLGAVGLWTNVGTIDGEPIDLRATVTSYSANSLTFETVGDDPSILISNDGSTAGELTLHWEVFKSGTNQTVFAFGNPTFSVADIDGIDGNPYTRETVIPSLSQLTGYTLENPTNLQIEVASGLVKASGTQDQSSESTSMVSFKWSNVSSWDITYSININSVTSYARSVHDGDGDFQFISPQSTEFLALDLDADDSTTIGKNYNSSYILGNSAVTITDSDTIVSQHVALGTDLGSATIILTNAQVGDVLTVGSLPSGISSSIDTSVSGKIIVTLSGTATIADYQTSIQAITFENANKASSVVDRVFETFVTNGTYQTNSEVAISTLSVDGDADGDTISDRIDLDDDNDGIPDAVEENGIPNLDTDGDGVIDRLDLDSDNDGISDLLESGQDVSVVDTNNDGILDSTTDTDNDGLMNVADLDDTDATSAGIVVPIDTDRDSKRDFQDLDSDNDGLTDIAEAGGEDVNGDGVDDTPNTSFVNPTTIPDLDSDGTLDPFEPNNANLPQVIDRDGDGVVDDITDSDGDGIPNVVDGTPDAFATIPAVDSDRDGISDEYDLDDDNDGIPDTVEESGVADFDTDGDGVPDRLDLDSDNDGILDILESGQNVATVDTNSDGILDSTTDADNDGLMDVADVDDTDATSAGVVTPIDTDGDSIRDFQDLDSDNDSLSDLIESGVPTSNDTDSDGMIDNPAVDVNGLPTVVALVATPLNTDGDTVPDYRDLDSDNDGLTDIAEAGGEDVNGDGVDDTPNTSFVNPTTIPDLDSDGTLDPFEPNNANLPQVVDRDGDGVVDDITDTDGDGIPDVVDETPDAFATIPAVDSDRDGISDEYDLDDDNDGIPDVVEENGVANVDTDGDGVPDRLDLDSDNDGILDLLESGQDVATVDTNSDGILDSTTDADNDGLMDVADADDTDATSAGRVVPRDTDGDSKPDFQDLDSDNDSLSDLIESGVPTSNDTDSDGMIDNPAVDVNGLPTVVALVATPLNTDGDTVPDYRDLDSDNDGLTDIAEAGGEDVNGDGVDDTANTSFVNPTTIPDLDSDGTLDPFEPNNANLPQVVDRDGDGVVDDITDSDGDGIPDIVDGTPDAFATIPAVDSDRDGIADEYDLDDDNDGIPDTVEESGVADLDTDGDGVPDRLDLDSDNDGILDILESGQNVATVDTNSDGILDSTTDADNDGLMDVVDVDDTDATSAGVVTPIDTDGDSKPDFQDLDSDNDGLSDLIEAGVPTSNDTNNDGMIDNPVVDVNGVATVVSSIATPLDTDGDSIPNYRDLDSDNDGIPDAVEENGVANVDTDGDGVPDRLDLDSDNDGILDLLESGQDVATVDTNSDGILDSTTDADNDGLMDVADVDDTDATSAGVVIPIDTDGDSIRDFQDVDSDNDGLSDLIESGVPTSNDTDSDGMIDNPAVDVNGLPSVVSSITTPLNSDGDSVPNYRDLDSDNDGLTDIEEAGGEDVNGDGVDDTPNTSFVNPTTIPDLDSDGTLDPFEPNNANLPQVIDRDGDGVVDDITDSDGDGIPDVVDETPDAFATTLAVDSDRDGISDEYDLDDDNDGIPDTVEESGIADLDTDGDGVPDRLDLDSDNDGILDILESGQDVATVDTNSDGILDSITDADNDGLMDVVDVDDTDGTSAGVVTPIDTDGDSKPDFQDVDSDNDSLSDMVEAGIPATNDADSDGMIDTPVVDVNGVVTVVAFVATPIDTDGDTVLDYRDLDSDNDGLADVDEVDELDENRDGIIDIEDSLVDGVTIPDSNGDDISDVLEVNNNNIPVAVDRDGNGIIDDITDSDGDGIPDVMDANDTIFGTAPFIDTDADGIADEFDIDDDNDGIPDMVENKGNSSRDTDGDGVIDSLDLDSDNDGILDIVEAGGIDSDNDGRVDDITDTDKDGLADVVDIAPAVVDIPVDETDGRAIMLLLLHDTDGDTKPDFQDVDSDNDGLSDLVEAGISVDNDEDNDGMIDNPAVDVNGISTVVTSIAEPLDSDRDMIPDYRELDSDNDGKSDILEVGGTDGNRDRLVDIVDSLVDVSNLPDIDGNGIPDYREINRRIRTAPTPTPEPTLEPTAEPIITPEPTETPETPELEPDRRAVDLSEPVTVAVLENDKGDLDVSSVQIELPDGFMDANPDAVLLDDRRTLIVPEEGTWSVNPDGTITYEAEEGSPIVEPTPISYSVADKSGKRLKTDTLIILNKRVVAGVNDTIEDCRDYENSVSIFGKWSFLLIVIGTFFGAFLFRKEKN